MTTPSVYVLRDAPCKNDEVTWFKFEDETSLLGRLNASSDFRPRPHEARELVATRLARLWKPRKVVGPVKPDNDYPIVRYGVPAFSQRAVDGLRDMLEPNGELLPLITPKKLGPYWAYNLLTIADVLDQSQSEVSCYPGTPFIDQIYHHEFQANRLGPLTLFWLRNCSVELYVTDTFVQRVQSLGLNGFQFLKVWPLPRGTDWVMLAKEQWRESVGLPPQMPFSSVIPIKRKFTTKPFTKEESGDLAQATEEFASDTRTRDVVGSAKATLEYIERTLREIRAEGSRNHPYLMDEGFRLGVAFGQVVAQELGWKWCMLVAESKDQTPAIVNSDQSLTVPVLEYFKRLVLNRGGEINCVLTFNMIKAGTFKAAPGELKLIG